MTFVENARAKLAWVAGLRCRVNGVGIAQLTFHVNSETVTVHIFDDSKKLVANDTLMTGNIICKNRIHNVF